MTERPDWDRWYLSIAKKWSERSKDPSTKVGAVIVRPDKTEASVGYNGFPRGVADEPGLLEDRQQKLLRVVHAEMNAILTAREPLHGYTLYLWPILCCARCAPHVIQAGIAHVVAPGQPCPEQSERWGEPHNLAHALLLEAGVKVTLLPDEVS